MARAVDVCVVAVLGLVLDVSRVDGDTTCLLFRCVIDSIVVEGLVAEQSCTVHRDSSCESGLTMVDVTDGTNVYVWLSSFEFFLSHQFLLVT